MFDGLKQDIIGGVRGLLKSPGFAAAALLTLALGIGATSAIFSVVKAVLVTPLPYSEPERRVQLFTRWISFDKTWIADAEIVDFRNMSKTMSAIAAWGTGEQNLTGDGEPIRVGVGFVTANTLDVLGARPMVGPTDPVTFATVPIALIVVALAASVIPAFRATRVSPLVALRSE